MTIHLTAAQRQVLQQNTPVRVVDEETQTAYVVIREEVYLQLRALLAPVLTEEDLDIREAYPLMDAVARQQGWEDPAMDIYNDLDPRRQP